MKKIAIVIGHSEVSQGAINDKHQVTEFMFNEPLAMLIGDILTQKSYMVCVVYRDTSYSELPFTVNMTEADIAVSLHCNAYNDKPNGSEVLYYHSSESGKRLAQCLQTEIVKCLGLKDRGIKPCVSRYKGKAGDRGGYLLVKTNMPTVIVEPFFIDSDESLELAKSKINELAQAYCQGIENYLSEEL